MENLKSLLWHYFCFDSKRFLYLKQLACRKSIGTSAMTEEMYLILKVQGKELGIYLNYVTKPSVELTRFSGACQSANSLQILTGAQKFSLLLKVLCTLSHRSIPTVFLEMCPRDVHVPLCGSPCAHRNPACGWWERIPCHSQYVTTGTVLPLCDSFHLQNETGHFPALSEMGEKYGAELGCSQAAKPICSLKLVVCESTPSFRAQGLSAEAVRDFRRRLCHSFYAE